MGVNQHGPAFCNLDAGLVEQPAIGRFKPIDLAVFVGNQGFPIERIMRHGPAEAGGVLEFAAKARCVDQQLLRHAAADHAGAAEAILLRQHDPGAVPRGNPCGAHPARAAPDDEKIDVVIGHLSVVLG